MNTDCSSPLFGRRSALRLLGSIALTGTAVQSSVSIGRAQTSDFDLESWFENTSNYDGVVDETGRDTVQVTVGVEANDGAFGFGPAAVRIDPGTTVVWEWSGNGGVHDVTAADGSFKSELVGDAGHTFEHSFEAEGVYKYACSPHSALGMRGAIVVGDAASARSKSVSESDGKSTSQSTADLDSWFERTSNYDGVVDETGSSQVAVEVGDKANGGAFGYGPAAIRVSKGTTVTWEWTGKGGAHNVVASDGAFESKIVGTGGYTFEHTFDEVGTYTYACTPHKPLGMKGAVVVTEEAKPNEQIAEPFDDPRVATTGGLGLAGIFGIALALPALVGVFQALTGDERSNQEVERDEQ
ncbi:halocyanin domain-containing protein [Haloferax sp. DFSO60]|uniref:halocyanin domain-containing protein n=1 Tax=Haloferax sp. DFSO60 TaxID=3388652 RepID=UPI00397E8225